MADCNVTGNAGVALIKGRVLDAKYIISGQYRTRQRRLRAKPGGRIAMTYKALKNGPKTGRALYATGNWMPIRGEPMSEKDFMDHLRWMVRESRLHVVCGER